MEPISHQPLGLTLKIFKLWGIALWSVVMFAFQGFVGSFGRGSGGSAQLVETSRRYLSHWPQVEKVVLYSYSWYFLFCNLLYNALQRSMVILHGVPVVSCVLDNILNLHLDVLR